MSDRIVIESPLNASTPEGVQRNLRFLLWCCRAVYLKAGIHAIGSHMLDPWFMDDGVPAEVRTHRKWFRRAMARPNDVIWLDASFKFVGYDQSSPAPLCILYRGDRDVAAAFKNLGEPA